LEKQGCFQPAFQRHSRVVERSKRTELMHTVVEIWFLFSLLPSRQIETRVCTKRFWNITLVRSECLQNTEVFVRLVDCQKSSNVFSIVSLRTYLLPAAAIVGVCRAHSVPCRGSPCSSRFFPPVAKPV
jgi:hypothetical protein